MNPSLRITYTAERRDDLFGLLVITKHVFIDNEEVATTESLYDYDHVLRRVISIDFPTTVVKGDE